MEQATTPQGNNENKRKFMLTLIAGVVVLAGIVYAVYWFTFGQYHVETDDAYVNGNIVQVTPQISGTAVAISADNTDFVKEGQILVTLDAADADVGLADAESKLARVVRSVRNLQATAEQLAATVEQRRADLAKAQDDLARREKIVSSGAVSAEDVQHARDAVKVAQANFDAAQRQFAATHVLIDNTTLRTHPDVLNAAAQVRSAFLTQARTKIPAPISGYVAMRNVQVGQHINAGTALMSVVPLDQANQIWVDANFKENQLANIRTGQPVTLESDIYGGHVEYQGTVVGFGAGTGSAFALLPPQNATGNWIKVVQRVPVRIAIDAKQLAAHPLQIGLSMTVTVDTHDRSGKRLENTPAPRDYTTDVFTSVEKLADAHVDAIIAANSGNGGGNSGNNGSNHAEPHGGKSDK